MKSRTVILIASAFLLTATSHAQQYVCIDTILVAGFGLDGELYSNDTVVGGDD